MKTIIYIIICVFMSCALLVSCDGSNRDAENRLKAADAVMTDAPDSALSILTGICPDSLSEKQKAWYALLRTKANAKNYLPVDKSLISKAVDYYEGKGDSLEAQSLYYLGCYYSTNYILDTALVILNNAYETALAANDIFYAAMSAREITDVYRYQFIIDEAQKWGYKAKDLFTQAEKPLHAAWMDLAITDALIYNAHYDSATAIINSAPQSVYYYNPSFRYNVKLNKIKLALQLDDYKNVLSLYDSLLNDGYTFKAHDRLNQAQASIEEGLYKDAERYLEMTQELNMIEADSLYLGKMRSLLLAANKEYRKAYESAIEFANDLMISDSRRLTNPQTLLLTDNYRLRVENHELQIQRNREYIITLVVVCLLLGIIILLMRKNYKTNLERKRSEMDRLISDANTLREDLTQSNDRYSDLSEQNRKIKESMDRQSSEFAIEVRSLFARHLSMFNNMCEIWFRNSDKSTSGNRLYKEVGSMLSEISNIGGIEELAEIINRHDNNWVTRFKEAYPNLSNVDYRFAIYLYLGFRPATIAVLTARSSTQAVHIAKSKLKKKLTEGCNTPDESLLKKLF